LEVRGCRTRRIRSSSFTGRRALRRLRWPLEVHGGWALPLLCRWPIRWRVPHRYSQAGSTSGKGVGPRELARGAQSVCRVVLARRSLLAGCPLGRATAASDGARARWGLSRVARRGRLRSLSCFAGAAVSGVRGTSRMLCQLTRGSWLALRATIAFTFFRTRPSRRTTLPRCIDRVEPYRKYNADTPFWALYRKFAARRAALRTR
jgi:hypothetical protein